MPGNTLDKTTLGDFLKSIEQQYGKARRTWVMDRGIPTEETLSRMRTAETPIHYLVGTPRGRLSKLEKEFLTLPWEQVRDSVEVKLIEQAGELYILSRSGDRALKERAMGRRRLKRLWKRLREIQQQKLTRDDLLLKLGAAKKEAGQAYRLVDLHLPAKDQAVTPKTLHLRPEQEQTPHRSAPRRELLAPL
jgi:transposase